MQTPQSTARRARRPVPGSMSFDRSNPHIYLGTLAGARKAKARTGSLVAPLDLDPETVSWPVQDLDVLLVSDPDHAVESARLAGALLRDGARMIVVVDGERSSPRVHRSIHSSELVPAESRGSLSDGPNFD